MPTISIILVNYNERDHLARVLRKLPDELVDFDLEIVVVDNQSRDGSPEMVQRDFPTVHLVRSGGNLMYGRGNNLGMGAARGEWLLILNPDVDWQAGQVRKFLSEAMTRPNLGLAGPRIMGSDGRLQRSAHRRFPGPATVFVDYCLPIQQLFLRLPWHPYLHSVAMHRELLRVAHLTGVCLLLPRTVFEQTQGFDPEFTMYLEETEWQQRVADLGLDRWYLGTSELVHFGSTEKRFAQASPHYLWGLWHYAHQHWGPGGRLRLLLALWAGSLISALALLLVLPVSWLVGRSGRRIRHYLQQYGRILLRLIVFPTHPPQA